MIPKEKSVQVIVQGESGQAGTIKSKTPKRWADLMGGSLFLGLFLFLTLPFRLALFLYTVAPALAYVLAKVIEARGLNDPI